MRTNNPDLTAFYNVVEESVISYLGGYEKAEIYFEKHNQLNDLWDFTERKYDEGWSTDKAARVWYSLYAYRSFDKRATENDLADYGLADYDDKYADDEYHWQDGSWVPKKQYKRKYGKAEKISGWKHLPVMA